MISKLCIYLSTESTEIKTYSAHHHSYGPCSDVVLDEVRCFIVLPYQSIFSLIFNYFFLVTDIPRHCGKAAQGFFNQSYF